MHANVVLELSWEYICLSRGHFEGLDVTKLMVSSREREREKEREREEKAEREREREREIGQRKLAYVFKYAGSPRSDAGVGIGMLRGKGTT